MATRHLRARSSWSSRHRAQRKSPSARLRYAHMWQPPWATSATLRRLRDRGRSAWSSWSACSTCCLLADNVAASATARQAARQPAAAHARRSRRQPGPAIEDAGKQTNCGQATDDATASWNCLRTVLRGLWNGECGATERGGGRGSQRRRTCRHRGGCSGGARKRKADALAQCSDQASTFPAGRRNQECSSAPGNRYNDVGLRQLRDQGRQSSCWEFHG